MQGADPGPPEKGDMKKRKTKVNRRSRSSGKRRQIRAIQPNLRNGAKGCDLLGCVRKALSPVLKVLGLKYKEHSS